MSVVGLLFSWTSWCGVNKNIPPWCQLWGKQVWWLSYLSLVLPASTVCEALSDQSCAVLCLNPQMPLAFTIVKPFICPWQVVRKGQDAGWDVCATCAGGQACWHLVSTAADAVILQLGLMLPWILQGRVYYQQYYDTLLMPNLSCVSAPSAFSAFLTYAPQ